MNLDLRQLRATVDELNEILRGAVLQRVRQPDEERLLLGCRAPGQSFELLICIAPRLARLHLTSRSFSQPPNPFGFCQKLRHDCIGARIGGVSLPVADRVVEIGLFRGGELERRLLVELSSHHANAFLCDVEGTILSAMTASASHRRELYPGRRYEPPLAAGEPSPSTVEPAPHKGAADTPSTVESVLPRGAASAVEPGGQLPTMFSSPELDARYAEIEERETQRVRWFALRRAVRQARTRIERTIGKVTGELERATQAEQWKRRGELLKANLHLVRRGVERVTLVDYYDEQLPSLEIELDGRLGPQENLERFFKLYRKYSGARQRIAERVAELSERDRKLAALLERIEAAEPDGVALRDGSGAPFTGSPPERELEHLAERARTLGVSVPCSTTARRKAEQPKAQSLPYRAFVSHDGFPIWVGRGAKQNHQLTFQLARGSDWWLHVAGTAGAHVVVRSAKGVELPQETLLDAAALAVFYSRGRGVGSVDVQYCRVSELRRPRNAPPGLVYVTRPRGLCMREEPDRLERLLAGGSPS